MSYFNRKASTLCAMNFFLSVMISLCSVTAVQAESPTEVVGVETVDLFEARDLHQKGAVFIDVRDQLSYGLGHIPGSVHLDFNEDAFVVLYASDALDRDTPVVFYCDSSLASAGAMASFFAAKWGYSNVYFFRDGYYSWLASDFPVEYQVASN